MFGFYGKLCTGSIRRMEVVAAVTPISTYFYFSAHETRSKPTKNAKSKFFTRCIDTPEKRCRLFADWKVVISKMAMQDGTCKRFGANKRKGLL